MTGRAVSYIRVSTAKQGQSGLGLEAQQEAVKAYCLQAGLEVRAEYREVESGKRCDRPQLMAALKDCATSGATLVVAKLDRLSRDAAFLLQLMKGAVPFVCCDNPHTTPLTLGVLAVVAEEERRAISKRTKAALAAKRTRLAMQRAALEEEARALAAAGDMTGAEAKMEEARRCRLGCPLGSAAFDEDAKRQAVGVRQAGAREWAESMREYIAPLRDRGLSFRAMARELERMGRQTRRGGCRWTGQQVQRLLSWLA